MSEFTLTATAYQFCHVLPSFNLSNIVRNYTRNVMVSSPCSYSFEKDGLPMEKGQLANLIKLSEFKELRDGWDGYDAMAIEQQSIENTKRILKMLTNPPELFPTCRGTLQLEYEKTNRDYIEFEIGSKEIRSIHVSPNGEKFKRRWGISEEAFLEVVRTIEEFHRQ